MPNSINDTAVLSNGVHMPWLGLGVYKVEEGNEVEDAVLAALRNGYRAIDTAKVYENEAGVGKAIHTSGVAREELFITTKVWNDDHGYDQTLKAFETSLDKLQLDYIDLYLVHWPGKDRYVETWRALEHLYEEKRVRAIGVSNFHIHHLDKLIGEAKIIPMVNQIELHPLLTQTELRDYCNQHYIKLTAWSPLMRGKLDLPILQQLAEKYDRTPAQIVLRWNLQNGIIVIPKSVRESRIQENANIFDFTLSADDMEQIERLNQNHRFGPDPDVFLF